MSAITTNHPVESSSFLYQPSFLPFDDENVLLLKEWMPIYLEEYVFARRCSKSTYGNYHSYMNTHILPTLGEYKLTQLTPMIIQTFVSDKLKHGRVDGTGGLSVKTVSEILLFLKQALRRACSIGKMPFNPCESVYPPKEEKKEVTYLEVEEQEQLESVIDPKFKENAPVFINLALATGMRIGEICALKQGDLDFDKKEICVSKTLGRVREIKQDGTSTYTVQSGTTKNKKQRKIAMNEDIEKCLRIYMDTMPSDLKDKEKPLFYNQKHKPMEPCGMRYHLSKYLKLANLRKIHFHTLRHTFATRCLEAEIAMKVVSKMLGHSNIGITMDLYTHVSDKTMHLEMSKMTRKNRRIA